MTQEVLKLALEVMRNQGDVSVDEWIATEKAIKEALAEHAMQEVQRLGQEIEQCQCPECQIKPHASDCAVHSEPAYPKGKCDCGAQPQQEPVGELTLGGVIDTSDGPEYEEWDIEWNHKAIDELQYRLVTGEPVTLNIYTSPPPQRTEQEPKDWKTPLKEDAPLVKWAKEQTAPQPEQEPVACQYAVDVAMPEYRCVGKCQYAAPPQRHELQAKGEHPAPCARHCEANAFKIVIKNLKAQLAQPEQEPVVGTKTWFEDGKVVTQHLTAKDIYKEPEQEPVAVKHMKEWIEYLKRKSDFGQHMKIPSEMSAGTCWVLALELEQFINTTPPQEKAND